MNSIAQSQAKTIGLQKLNTSDTTPTYATNTLQSRAYKEKGRSAYLQDGLLS